MAMAILFTACQSERIEGIERAFYSWKNGGFYDMPIAKLKELEVKKIYIKMFEVDYNTALGNYPFAKNTIYRNYFDAQSTDTLHIIPTVFVKNDIFKHNNEKSLDKLADDILFLLAKKSRSEYGSKEVIFNYSEIQIDCDWTISTQQKYFYLLRQLKQKSKKIISCTLRLYPYAFPDKMGVPPVDKAMLMCYNLIAPLEKQTKNSILDLNELEKYLKKDHKYPLHLDVALPVFFWSQLYQNNQFTKLLPLSKKTIETFATEITPMWYEVDRDTTIGYETRIRKGDQIKNEQVSNEVLEKAIALIKNRVPLKAVITIALFDLNTQTFNMYSDEEIRSFYNHFNP